jgi:hypothetical protein
VEDGAPGKCHRSSDHASQDLEQEAATVSQTKQGFCDFVTMFVTLDVFCDDAKMSSCNCEAAVKLFEVISASCQQTSCHA